MFVININSMTSKIRLISISIITSLIVISCSTDRPPKRATQKEDHLEKVHLEKITKPIKIKEINEINFYFENSGSMNGYLNGDNFLETMIRIIGNSSDKNLQTFFVNTDKHKTENLLDKIENNKIQVGNVSSSDHQFIFKTAIENAVNNNVSIVVTDGIYSVKGKSPSIVSVKIEQTFEKALKENAVETVVLKMGSNFKGTYYSETCKPGHKAIKIDQMRPYYIFLFGNKDVINKALEDIVILNDLKGQEEQARFFLTKEMKVNYSILFNGNDKKGDFERADRKNPIIKKIKFKEKFKPRNSTLNEAYFQFAIAVDFSDVGVSENYLKNPVNYTVSKNTNYEIIEIKDLKNIDQLTRADVKKRNNKATHLMILKGKTKLYGDVDISLNINTPNWIKNTGTDDDCSIKGDTITTFAFDRLMNGMADAYKKVSKKQEYFNLIITINP